MSQRGTLCCLILCIFTCLYIFAGFFGSRNAMHFVTTRHEEHDNRTCGGRKRWSDDRIYIISWMASVFVNTVWNVGCVRRLEVQETELWNVEVLFNSCTSWYAVSPILQFLFTRGDMGFLVIDLQNSMIKYTTEVASLELPSYIRIIRSHYQDPYEPVSISLFGSATASSWTMPKFSLLSRWSLSIFHFWRRYFV